MKIIADSAIPFLQGVLEPWAEVRYLPGAEIAPEEVRDADALLIRTRTRCDERLLGGSRVRLIATATIGFDHIDTAWCAAHGIRVCTAAGCNARGVLQWAGAVLAHLARTQGWQPAGRTLGVVGVGHVGSLVKEYAETWGFRVLCCDPPREAREHCGFLPLEEVARQADILTFHTPLDDTTRRMAGDALFARMKPGAVILNSSRGEVVDGAALLRSGLACVLDVWEHEPAIDRRHTARHAAHRGLFRAGQSQCHGHVGRYAGPFLRPAPRRMVPASGRPFDAPADLVAGALHHHRGRVRHRGPEPQPEGPAGGFRADARPLPLPPRILLAKSILF